MIRLMMISAAYRTGLHATRCARLAEGADPGNRCCGACGCAGSEAEAMRDAVLTASGKLN